MTDRELMQMALHGLEMVSAIDRSFSQRETIRRLNDRLAQPEHNYKPDFDLLFEANSADIEALTDAQFTLEAIKNADPGTHDEIIDASLRLIKIALSKSVFGPMERLADKIGVEL
jgi:hypothetical protein